MSDQTDAATARFLTGNLYTRLKAANAALQDANERVSRLEAENERVRAGREIEQEAIRNALAEILRLRQDAAAAGKRYYEPGQYADLVLGPDGGDAV